MTTQGIDEGKRWLALVVLCVGMPMIVPSAASP